MDLMQAFSSKYQKEAPPAANVGDTVRVHIRVKEGNRERIQVFEGTVIAKTAASRRPSRSAACLTASAWRRFSPSMRPRSKRSRPFARAKSAEPSCTICGTVWARAPRSKSAFKTDPSPKKERHMPLLFGYIVNVTKNSGRKLKKI